MLELNGRDKRKKRDCRVELGCVSGSGIRDEVGGLLKEVLIFACIRELTRINTTPLRVFNSNIEANYVVFFNPAFQIWLIN